MNIVSLERKFVVYRAVESHHFQGGDGAFDAFVAVHTTGTVERLLEGVAGENTKDDGVSMLDCDIGEPLRNGLADEFKVTGFALNDTADTDDSIDLTASEKNVCGRSEFESAWNTDHLNVLFLNAIFFEGGDSTFEEGVGDFRIPFGGDDTDTETFSVGHSRGIVIGKIGLLFHRLDCLFARLRE